LPIQGDAPSCGAHAGYREGMGIDHVLEPEKARELIASNEVVVLDVRGDDEWHDHRVAGARHTPGDALESALEEIDADRPVLIVCDDGERSAGVAAELRESGREAACIDGGMKAWESDKLPMQPSADADDDAKV
jgi:rhodanese-related sulfurtransferase